MCYWCYLQPASTQFGSWLNIKNACHLKLFMLTLIVLTTQSILVSLVLPVIYTPFEFSDFLNFVLTWGIVVDSFFLPIVPSFIIFAVFVRTNPFPYLMTLWWLRFSVLETPQFWNREQLWINREPSLVWNVLPGLALEVIGLYLFWGAQIGSIGMTMNSQGKERRDGGGTQALRISKFFLIWNNTNVN